MQSTNQILKARHGCCFQCFKHNFHLLTWEVLDNIRILQEHIKQY